MLAASVAAAPPLEPPAVRSVSQGLAATEDRIGALVVGQPGRHVGVADDHRARRARPGRYRAVLVRHLVELAVPTVVRRPATSCPSLRVIGRRRVGPRSHRAPGRRRPPWPCPCSVGVERNDGVERRVVRFDLLEVGLQRLGGDQLLASQPARQHPCRQPARSIAHGRRGQLSVDHGCSLPSTLVRYACPSTVPSPCTGASPSSLPCQSGPLRCCVSRQPVAAPTPAHAAPTTRAHAPTAAAAARATAPPGPRATTPAGCCSAAASTRSAHAGTLAVRAAQAHRARSTPRRAQPRPQRRTGHGGRAWRSVAQGSLFSPAAQASRL